MRYRTKADVRTVEVNDESRARVVWSVPAWETGLHEVEVEFRAPRGATIPIELQDTAPGVDFQVDERTNRTVVKWRRTHIPRMTAWPLTVDVPVDSIAVPVTVPNTPDPVGFRPLRAPDGSPIAWALFLVAALILAKRRSIEARMGRSAALVQGSWTSVIVVTGAVVALGQWCVPNYLVCALPLIAFSLHRPSKWAAGQARKDWRPVNSSELRRAESRASDFLDGTTIAGLSVLIAGGVGLCALGEPTAALLLLPIFLTGTRHHMSATTGQKTSTLRAFAADLRVPTSAPEMALAWEQASDGTARLRAHLHTQRPGLMTLSFIVTSSPVGFVLRRKVMLLVETRAQSEADDLVRRRTSSEPDLRSPNGSILRLVDWDLETVELLRVLARKTPKPMKASRGTWLLREISEPGCRAA